MARNAGQHLHTAAHLNGLAEQAHLFCALHQRPAQGPLPLVAHEDNGALLPPEVVLQVVADAPGLAHAAGRKNDLRPPVKVDGLGILGGHGQLQARKADGVHALFHQSAGLGVVAFGPLVLKNVGGLHGQRAVHIHGKIAVPAHQALLLDLAQEIQHLLGAAHRKAGDHQAAALVEGALQKGGQGGHVVRPGAVAAVAVGRFHHHIVGLFQILRVPQQGLV